MFDVICQKTMGFSIVMSHFICFGKKTVMGNCWMEQRFMCVCFFFWMAVPFLGEMTWVGFTVMESLGFRLCWESWCYLSPGSLGSVPGGNQNPRRALACHQSQVFFGGSSDIVYCVAVLPDASWWLLRPCEMHGCHWIIVKRLFDCWNVQLILVAVMEGYDM